MKFTDGFWLMQAGVHASHPAEVLDATAGPGSLVVYAPTKRIRHRGDLLTGPAVTLSFTAPIPDVIGVEITHFAGGTPPDPQFQLLPGAAGDTAEPSTCCDAQAATFTSGALSAVVSRDARWSVDFAAGGRRLTGSPAKGTALIGTDDGRHFIREQLDLGVHDFVYGLGERFGPLVKNGQAVDIWNADGGTSSEQAYKNVPFFLTNAGYGVFVNHPGRVSFEVASEAISRVQFSVEGQAMQYFLIYGPSPKEILGKYTALTGRPPGCPAWSFGLWLSTSFTTSYDEATVTQLHRRDGRARTCRCTCSTSTRSGCASSTGATSSGTPGRSPTHAACWPGSRRAGCASASGSTRTSRSGHRCSRGQGQGLPAAAARGEVWQGTVAARHGRGRLHQPRGPRLVRGQA